MSLGLVGTGTPPRISFDQDGTPVGLDSAAGCPTLEDGDILQQALLAPRTVDHSQLDSMPLTIGKYGCAIEAPR